MIKIFVCYKRNPADPDNLETADYSACQVSVEHGFLKLVEDIGGERVTYISLDTIWSWTEQTVPLKPEVAPMKGQFGQ